MCVLLVLALQSAQQCCDRKKAGLDIVLVLQSAQQCCERESAGLDMRRRAWYGCSVSWGLEHYTEHLFENQPESQIQRGGGFIQTHRLSVRNCFDSTKRESTCFRNLNLSSLSPPCNFMNVWGTCVYVYRHILCMYLCAYNVHDYIYHV